MTGYVQNSVGHERSIQPRFPGAVSQAGLTPEQLGEWRASINKSQHPVMVLDGNFRPTLLNESLRVKLSDPSSAEGIDQPTAFVWQTICDTAARVVAEAAGSSSNEFAEAFPIQRRCFAAIGSLLRSSSGHIVGAVVNLGDLMGSQDRLRSALTGASIAAVDSGAGSSERNSEFQQWNANREQARQKMLKLSRRETQVVTLVSEGLPNKSIAHALDISVKTIEKHRANATRKLGVSSTPEMVRIAVVAGGKSSEVGTSVFEGDASGHSSVG
jgi:DNA-binding CsgD family transcriptional regulator